MTHDPYLGPGPELLAMLDRAAVVDPRLMPPETFEEGVARRDRMVQAYQFSDLSPADQEWLNQAVLAVSGGGSSAGRLAPDLVLSDWPAEDAAVDAGGPVPAIQGAAGEALTADELDELDQYDEPDLPGAEDDGWVGV